MKIEEAMVTPLTEHEMDSMRKPIQKNLDEWRAGEVSLDPNTVLVSRFLATVDSLRSEDTPLVAINPDWDPMTRPFEPDLLVDGVQTVRTKAYDEFGKELKWEDEEGWPQMDADSCADRAIRGYANSDLWNFDSYLAWMLPEALEDLISNGYIDYGKKMRKQVRKIVRDLRFYYGNIHNYNSAELQAEAIAKIPKIFKRLGKIYYQLWI